MHIPRLLFLSLLIPVCVAPVAAQSFSDKIPASSHPQLHGRLVAPPEFRAQVLPLPPNARARMRDLQPQSSFDSTFGSTLDSTPAASDRVCLSIRSYRVTRDDPGSDSTRLVGYSECQPAVRFQMKTAVDSREIVPR